MSTFGKILSVILGILIIVAGIYFAATAASYPIATGASVASVFTIFLGIAAIVAGIFGIVAYFKFREERGLDGWDLVVAIISIVVGILVLANPGISLVTEGIILRVVIPIWTLVYAINTIRRAITKSKVNDYTEVVGFHIPWVLELIVGILLVILGIAMIFSPQLTFMSAGVWIALQAIGIGVNMITMAFAF